MATSIRDEKIEFQKNEGPYSIQQRYEFDNNGREMDVHDVSLHGEVVKSFSRSDISEWGSHVIAMDYIAKELINNHSDHFDIGGYKKEYDYLVEEDTNKHLLSISPLEAEKIIINKNQLNGVDFSVEKMSLDNFKEKFIKDMEQVDWYAHYSDDYQVRRRGSEQISHVANIARFLEGVDKEAAHSLWKEHAPKELNSPFNNSLKSKNIEFDEERKIVSILTPSLKNEGNIDVHFQREGGPYALRQEYKAADNDIKESHFSISKDGEHIKSFISRYDKLDNYIYAQTKAKALDFIDEKLREEMPEYHKHGFRQDTVFDQYLNKGFIVESRATENYEAVQYQLFDNNTNEALFRSKMYNTFQELAENIGQEEMLKKIRELHIVNNIPIVKDLQILNSELCDRNIQRHQEQQFKKELESAVMIGELGKEPIAKELYYAYAKNSIEDYFDGDYIYLDKKITENMLKDNVRENRVSAALKYSPAVGFQDNVTKTRTIKDTIEKVKKENPQLAQKKTQSIKM